MASWSVQSNPDQAVEVQALATGALCCALVHFTLTVPLSTQVYKWITLWWAIPPISNPTSKPPRIWQKSYPFHILPHRGHYREYPPNPGLAFHSEGSKNTPSHFMLWQPEKKVAIWITWPIYSHFTISEAGILLEGRKRVSEIDKSTQEWTKMKYGIHCHEEQSTSKIKNSNVRSNVTKIKYLVSMNWLLCVISQRVGISVVLWFKRAFSLNFSNRCTLWLYIF